MRFDLKGIILGSLFFFFFFPLRVHSAVDPLILRVLNEQGEYSCLSDKEQILLEYLNNYRRQNHLPAIQNSRSLNKVARIHAFDLAENHPEQGVDPRGKECNLHSWSAKGFWMPVCYTSDHFYLMHMLSKPGEITRQRYDDVGYENVYWSSVPQVFPYRVLEAWKKSPGHNALMVETGKWEGIAWQAIGVGIYKNVATIWLGSKEDAAGPLPLCPPINLEEEIR